MIEIKELSSVVSVDVTMDITGAPAVRREYTSVWFAPDRVTVTFVNDGFGWKPARVVAEGFRALKPAKDGTPRLSGTRGEQTWSFRKNGTTYPDIMPEWLATVVNDMTLPTGDFTVMPGSYTID